MSERPLEGRIVLDLTTALAGPYATLLLAGLGARVIKIENPLTGGDSSRSNSPYVTGHGLTLLREADEDMSLSMMLRGRNKESVTLNLKSPEGRETFLALAAQADIVVENFSAGVTARLGIDYASVRQVNQRLIYTSISGFGADPGSEGDKAMDTIIQAMSGMMLTAGRPGDPPIRFGVPIADLSAPLYAVIGTLAAVIQTDRTGVGQHVDVSMLGALTSLVACEPFDALEEVGIPLRTGQTVPRLAPFGLFEAQDGWVAVCAPTDALANTVLAAIERPELGEDPRFSQRDQRVAHAEELHGLIADWVATQTVETALAAFGEHGVPAGPVRDTGSAVRDERVLARGEVVPLTHPVHGPQEDIFGSGVPIRMSESDTSLDRPAPYLGEHTEQVLSELLGYDPERIAALRRASGIAGR